MTKQLPKHLSTAILKATEHAIKIADGKVKYNDAPVRLNMGVWVREVFAGGMNPKPYVCEVCLGGSLLLWARETLPLRRMHDFAELLTFSIDDRSRKAMYALNDVRNGRISDAVSDWYGSLTPQYQKFADLGPTLRMKSKSYGLRIGVVSELRHLNNFPEGRDRVINEVREAAKGLANILRGIGA